MSKIMTSRPVRSSRPKYAELDAFGTGNGLATYSSQEEPHPTLPATRVDLAKMKMPALRKYAKAYEVPGIHTQTSKEELCTAVMKHWANWQINEENVLQNLFAQRGGRR